MFCVGNRIWKKNGSIELGRTSNDFQSQGIQPSSNVSNIDATPSISSDMFGIRVPLTQFNHCKLFTQDYLMNCKALHVKCNPKRVSTRQTEVLRRKNAQENENSNFQMHWIFSIAFNFPRTECVPVHAHAFGQ